MKTTIILETKTGTYTPEQIKSARLRYFANDFQGAQTAAIKSALKHQKTNYLYACYMGYKICWDVPSLPSGIYFEIIPTGKLSVTMNQKEITFC
jgi:hypothetical protein